MEGIQTRSYAINRTYLTKVTPIKKIPAIQNERVSKIIDEVSISKQGRTIFQNASTSEQVNTNIQTNDVLPNISSPYLNILKEQFSIKTSDVSSTHQYSPIVFQENGKRKEMAIQSYKNIMNMSVQSQMVKENIHNNI